MEPPREVEGFRLVPLGSDAWVSGSFIGTLEDYIGSYKAYFRAISGSLLGVRRSGTIQRKTAQRVCQTSRTPPFKSYIEIM